MLCPCVCSCVLPNGKKVKSNHGWSQSNIHCCLHPNAITFWGGNLFTFYLWLLEPCKNRACRTASTFKIFMKFVNVISYQNYVKTEIQSESYSRRCYTIDSEGSLPPGETLSKSFKKGNCRSYMKTIIRVLLDFDITNLSNT